jgi:hypothetical protein
MGKSAKTVKKHDFQVRVVSSRGSFSYLISASTKEEAERKAKTLGSSERYISNPARRKDGHIRQSKNGLLQCFAGRNAGNDGYCDGRQPRPPDLDKFPTAFSVVGEKQEKVADEETSLLLQRFSGNPAVEKARTEFERAQEVEERSLHDFDGVDSPCDKGTGSWDFTYA